MKRIGSPKNGNIRAFFAKCRESPVRAFRKKTPISVRRCRGGLRGIRKRSAVLWLFLRKASLSKVIVADGGCTWWLPFGWLLWPVVRSRTRQWNLCKAPACVGLQLKVPRIHWILLDRIKTTLGRDWVGEIRCVALDKYYCAALHWNGGHNVLRWIVLDNTKTIGGKNI